MDSTTPKICGHSPERWLALDLLRGLSIFGMVFSAIVPLGVLPGWMYQWVDWVFPIFIFCMGVAIPLAGWKKADNRGQFFYNLFTRFLLLWAFAYLVPLLGLSGIKGKLNFELFNIQVNAYDIQAFVLLGFFAMFAVYWQMKPSVKKSIWIRVAGVCVIIGLIALFHWFYGAPLHLHRRSTLILLLAFLYLFGALIWYVTRNCPWGRLAFFAGIIGISIFSKEIGFDTWLYTNNGLNWVFNMEEVYFLLLLIPATWVGDYMIGRLGWRGEKESVSERPPVGHLFYILLGLLAVFLCFGLYLRWHEWALLAVSLSVLTLCLMIARNSSKHLFPLMAIAAALLIVGLLLDPYEGGIKKVPVTFSCCFTMGGICIILLLFSHYICKLSPGSFFVRTFSGAGANPMMSYVAYGYFVMPILNLTFLIGLYRASNPTGEPWIEVLKAFVIVLITMYLVSIMSRKGVYWRASFHPQ